MFRDAVYHEKRGSPRQRFLNCCAVERPETGRKTAMKHLTPLTALLWGSILFVPSAHASPEGSNSVRVRASVPIACWVRAETPIDVQAGSSGRFVEACNSPGGFVVSANYRPLGANERAIIVHGGQQSSLSRTGNQILRQSNIATIRAVDYQFNEVSLDTPLVIALTIEPI